MRTLIVVDMQNDFIDGSLGTPEAVAIVPKVKAKIDEYLKTEDSIIFTQDTHYSNYLKTNEGKHLPIEHCIWGTDGWKIREELKAENIADRVIEKNTFGYSDWDSCTELFHVDKIEIVGLCTDICVITNALTIKSMYPDCEIVVDASCCAGTTLEKHEAALKIMESCQINIINK